MTVVTVETSLYKLTCSYHMIETSLYKQTC